MASTGPGELGSGRGSGTVEVRSKAQGADLPSKAANPAANPSLGASTARPAPAPEPPAGWCLFPAGPANSESRALRFKHVGPVALVLAVLSCRDIFCCAVTTRPVFFLCKLASVAVWRFLRGSPNRQRDHRRGERARFGGGCCCWKGQGWVGRQVLWVGG